MPCVHSTLFLPIVVKDSITKCLELNKNNQNEWDTLLNYKKNIGIETYSIIIENKYKRLQPEFIIRYHKNTRKLHLITYKICKADKEIPILFFKQLTKIGLFVTLDVIQKFCSMKK